MQEQAAHRAVSLVGLRPAGHQAQSRDQARRGAAKLGEEAAGPSQVGRARAEPAQCL